MSKSLTAEQNHILYKEAKNINSALNTAIESVDIMLNQGVAKAMDLLNQSNS